MGEARSVIEELWRIFTFYSLHGDATASPKRLRSSQFVKLLSDCGLVASGGGGGGGLHKAEIFIAFQKEITPGASGVRCLGSSYQETRSRGARVPSAPHPHPASHTPRTHYPAVDYL